MKKYTIPEQNRDLRKAALKNRLAPPLLYLAYVAFLGYAFWFYISRRPEDLGRLSWWVYLLFSIAVLVSGWLIFRMGKWVLDRDFSGEIKGYELVRSYGRGLSRTASTVTDFHTYIKITAVDDNGKKHKITVPLFEDGYDGYYKTGGRLIKYKGLNYPLCLESEQEGIHLCAFCGVRTYYKEGKAVHGEAQPEMRDGLIICRSCRHTLINIEHEEDSK